MNKGDFSLEEAEHQNIQDLADEKELKVPQSAVLGAICCAVLGAALGWLAGIGVLTIQDTDSFGSASPFLGILAGAGLGGMVGCVGGWLAAMRTPYLDGERVVRAEAIVKQIVEPPAPPVHSAILRVVDPSSTEIPTPDRR